MLLPRLELAWWKRDTGRVPIVYQNQRRANAARRKIAALGSEPWQFLRSPSFDLRSCLNPNDGSVCLHREEVEDSVIVGVGHCHRFDRRQTRWQGTLLELSLAKIHEHVKFARAIDDNGIRIAVTVQIGPRQIRSPLKFRQRGERAGTCRLRYFLGLSGVPSFAPSTRSRSPSASMSTAHAPV